MLLEDLINSLYSLTEQKGNLVIKRDNLKALVKRVKGAKMTIVFRKKDGTMRTLNTQTGVQKNITGRGLSYDPDKYGYLILWDLDKQGYRTVNLKTIQKVMAKDDSYRVQESMGKTPVVFKNGPIVLTGEAAWRKWMGWADINRRDDFLYKVLNTIKLQGYTASVKQQQVLDRWFNRKR